MMFVDFILHIDKFLNVALQEYGIWIYVLMFLIIFIETGLVFAPFLPGDSLLFVAGALAVSGSLNILLLLVLLSIAAILGDTLNYWIGRNIGMRIFQKYKFLKEERLKQTEEFYDKHGGKAIIMARFLPFIRTFAPFVAGIGKMKYPKFLNYNVIGGIAWVSLFTLAGYAFGNMPLVKDNFSLFVIGIIVITVGIAIAGMLRHKMKKNNKS